jgi:hypothetical protein
MRVPGGLSLAMMDTGTGEVTGREIAAGLNTTTIGTTTGSTGILTASTITITTSGV